MFRFLNVNTPAQVRELTASIQRAASRFDDAAGPVLVAADQEGGQFLALGDGPTPFPGAMALGATGDEALAERVGRATGLELLAMGVNTEYAPVCGDVEITGRNAPLVPQELRLPVSKPGFWTTFGGATTDETATSSSRKYVGSVA